jgi:hypothetical protein
MEKKDIKLAIKNIINYGDTDIFPFPLENQMFYDKFDEVVNFIMDLNKNFTTELSSQPPVNITSCAPVGYTGFRWATQIDPIWNAYFLALIVSIASEIENARIPINEKTVFSYRFKPDFNKGTLFDETLNWKAFQKRSYELASQDDIKYVVICDISDFYTRIYHHHLQNALQRCVSDVEAAKRIMLLLQKFSGLVSYGLPIGGPGARLLAELVLNNNDRILRMNQVKFCRFVDDFHLFTKSREEAQFHLSSLAIKLLKNEGLSLTKSKTQILTSHEFMKLVESRLNGDSEEKQHQEKAKFMSLQINYDPYSSTAQEDYERIKDELKTFNITALLNDELRKSRINQHFSKQLLKAFSILDSKVVSNCFISILRSIDTFYPIFGSVMMALHANFERITDDCVDNIEQMLRKLVVDDSYIIQIELNVAYLIRILGHRQSVENEQALLKIWKKYIDSVMVRTLVMQVFARWRNYPWLTDIKSSFPTMSKWERKVFIIASYMLGDEGSHWREHNKKDFTPFELIIRDWVKERMVDPKWVIPL